MRTTKPRLSSYYFETLALKVFNYAGKQSDWQHYVDYFFRTCPSYLWVSCADPKGLGPDLDTGISYETKKKIADAMSTTGTYTQYALKYEREGNYKEAIKWWGYVFGAAFPSYG